MMSGDELNRTQGGDGARSRDDEVKVSPLGRDGRRRGLKVPLNCLRRNSLLSIISAVAALDHRIISGLFKDET